MRPPVNGAADPATTSGPTWSSGDRGGVLFLFPVGFLIVILLGAIAVDLGNVWLQQRRLADAADAAANDAASWGIDQAALRTDGELVLDPERVRRSVEASVAGQDLPAEVRITTVTIGVGPGGEPSVDVALESTVAPVFGRVAGAEPIAIRASGEATLRDGP